MTADPCCLQPGKAACYPLASPMFGTVYRSQIWSQPPARALDAFSLSDSAASLGEFHVLWSWGWARHGCRVAALQLCATTLRPPQPAEPVLWRGQGPCVEPGEPGTPKVAPVLPTHWLCLSVARAAFLPRFLVDVFLFFSKPLPSVFWEGLSLLGAGSLCQNFGFQQLLGFTGGRAGG